MEYQTTYAYAQQMDDNDVLALFRDRFIIPDEKLIYLDGNSLGRPTKASILRSTVLMEEWSKDLIRGYHQGWWDAPLRIGEMIAPLIGAAPGQVILTDTVSTNLFKLAHAALTLANKRTKIITDMMNFPSDLYILQGIVRLVGGEINIVQIGSTDDEISPNIEELLSHIDDNTGLVTLSHVLFKSGYLYDMKKITQYAHSKGALVLWDLSHSVGVVPMELDDCHVDFAVGCTYKYLNGGPGSPAFLYINKKIQDKVVSPIWAWWGQKDPFRFQREYFPSEGISRFLSGSQPMLSMLTMEAGLPIFQEAGINRIREKSISMGQYMIYLVENLLRPLGVSIGSPRDPSQRGSHVSIRHAEGYRINRALIEEMDVIPDFREPDNIRLGLTPLYTSFGEIWQAVDRIRMIIQEHRYENYPRGRLAVT